jgi:hypothetical protein
MIARAELLRFADTPFGVFGWLDLFDEAEKRVARFPVAEDDWLHNEPGKSAILAGRYLCRRVVSPSKGETFEISGVPGRSHILFHEGNTEENTEGCVLLGTAFGALPVKDEDDPNHPQVLKWGVTSSKAARARFMTLLEGVDSFPVTIRWSIGDWRE